MREAGQRFVEGIVLRVDADRYSGAKQLFTNLNIMSSIRYEGAEASGEILLGPTASMDGHFCVQFSQPVELVQHRRARKLLELAARGLSLHTDSEALYGLVLPIACDREDTYSITIKGHRTWELRRGESSLLRVVDGLPKLPKPAVDLDRLRNDLQRIFPEVSEENARSLGGLVETAIREKHGTMIVISEAAESESLRLATQGTAVSPFACTPQLLQHLTSIDGAILLSTSGVCHAIGVILDGLATADGDPARGARYNSAVRYCAASQHRCVLIVVSEDGDVTIIPSLRPRISRALVDSMISRMLDLRDKDDVKRKEFFDVRNWLHENQFYLRPEQCEELNSVIEGVDLRIRESSKATVWLEFRPLKGNPDLDERLYFLP
jgi:hypothetical protein